MRIDSFFLLLLLVSPALAGTEVYKYTDKNGGVSFTDNLSNVPDEQRETAEKIQMDSPSGPISSPVEKGGTLYKWIEYHAYKIVSVLILVIVLAYIVQHFVTGFLIRLIIRLLIIFLLGTVIYGLFITQKDRLKSESFEKTVEPYLPSPSLINKAKEQVKKLEEGQKKEEELIDSLDSSEKQ